MITGTVFRNSCVNTCRKEEIMQQKDNDQFSFINEKIKEKPVNKKRLLMQAGFIALMAVVFGIIASLVFAYFQPKFESLFYPEEEPVVTIPQDSVAVTELTEETETSEETEASEEPQAPSAATAAPGA
jgi:serine protease Do